MHTREKTFSRLLSVTCHDNHNYISVLPKKTIDKANADNIKEVWVKEREKKWVKKAMDAQGIITRIIQKITNKIAKAKFVVVWFTTTLSWWKDWFH